MSHNTRSKRDGKSLSSDSQTPTETFQLNSSSQEAPPAPAPPPPAAAAAPPYNGPLFDGYVTVLPIDLAKAPSGSTGVDVIFLYSPTILGGQCLGPSGKIAGECIRAHDVVLSYRWKAGDTDQKTLVVRHEDGQPLAKAFKWFSPGDPVRDWSNLPSRAQRYPERHRLIRGVQDDKLRERAEAMCRFDEMTDPYVLNQAKDQLEGDVVDLTRALSLRTLQRASWAAQNREFEPMASEDAAVADRARRVEEYVRQLLLEINPGPATPQLRGTSGRLRPSQQPSLHVRKLEETIAAFVAGELHMTKLIEKCPPPMAMDGIPDGPNLFAFAECALLFIRLDLQPRFWRRLLPIFVCAAEFFATSYWNFTHRRLDAYHPDNLNRGRDGGRHSDWDGDPDAEQYENGILAGVSSPFILRHLEQRYRGLTLSQLATEFSSIVGQALREDPAISHPTRTAKEFV